MTESAKLPGAFARRLPSLVAALTLLGAVGIAAGAPALASSPENEPLAAALVLFAGIAVLYGVMGAVIETRRRGHRVGRLLLAAGAMLVVTFGGFQYGALLGAERGLGDPLAGALAWIGTMGIAPTVLTTGPLLAILFPDGRLPGRRWKPVVAVIGLAVVGTDLCAAFLPGPLQEGLPDNPIGLAALAGADGLRAISDILLMVGFLGGVCAAVVAVVVRFRRSSGPEREQMKWFVASILAIAVTTPLSAFDGSETTSVFDFALIAGIGLVPVSVGIAVTRYRLYQIDTIINRTIVYGLLTAILAGGSAAVVGILQRAFQNVLGPGSEVTIIVTTLVVVTAFNPLRVALQAVVDRRFKEARDPGSVLSAFADRLERAPWRPDDERTARQLLGEAMGAFAATGGWIVITRNDAPGGRYEAGGSGADQGGDPAVTLTATGLSVAVELALTGRTAIRAVDEASLDAAEQALGRIAGQLSSVPVDSRPSLALERSAS